MSDFELIERYLADQLSPEEKKAFRSRLLNDPAFNQEFQELKEIRFQLKQREKQEVLDLFNGIEETIKDNKTTKDQTVMKKVISIAASLFLIATLAYLGLSTDEQPSSSELYDKYYSPYPSLLGQVRGESEENLSLEQKALNAYDLGNFAESEGILKNLVENNATAMNYFYLGLAQLEMNKAEEAVASFNTVVNNFDAFKEQARWHLALAHLKNGNDDSALSGLASLVVNKSEYASKAEQIMAEYGLDFDGDEIEIGIVDGYVEQRPKGTAPDGSMESMDTYGKRKWQFGKVRTQDGQITRFVTDEPIENLHDGDNVVYVMIDRGRGRGNGRSNGLAYVVDKY